MLTIDLSGETALVVGGSRGIGAGIVQCLSRAGASVVFTHTGNPASAARIDALLAAVRGEGGAAEAVVLDAREASGTTRLVQRIAEQHGRLDVLVHNAGHNDERPAVSVEDDEWQAGIDLNLSSAFYGVRAVLPHMLRRKRGRIILIGSSVVYSGGGGAIDYAAGKAGLTGLMTYLCKTYTRSGILTNVIHPCVIETDLLRERYADAAARRSLLDGIPAGRLGQPEDIAGLVAFLASSWGDYICGQAILVDGGRTVFR
jgi:3-oxoacyl-[acyl-carrier protein] reductase